MADEHDLEKEIADVLALTKPDAFKPDALWYTKLGTWACELGDAIHAVTLKLEKGNVEIFRGPLIAAAFQVWDDQIVPLDVPNVPAWLETYVENAIRPTIPAVVDEVLERIKGALAA